MVELPSILFSDGLEETDFTEANANIIEYAHLRVYYLLFIATRYYSDKVQGHLQLQKLIGLKT